MYCRNLILEVIVFVQVSCEVEKKRMCLFQANGDLAEAAEKLEVIRKKLSVSLNIMFVSCLNIKYQDLESRNICSTIYNVFLLHFLLFVPFNKI